MPHATIVTNCVWEIDSRQTSGIIFVGHGSTRLRLNVPIEEERKQDYDPRHFYPVKLGEIFHDKYEVVVEVFGGGSTVWLARNLQRYVFSRNVSRDKRFVICYSEISTTNHVDQPYRPESCNTMCNCRVRKIHCDCPYRPESCNTM